MGDAEHLAQLFDRYWSHPERALERASQLQVIVSRDYSAAAGYKSSLEQVYAKAIETSAMTI